MASLVALGDSLRGSRHGNRDRVHQAEPGLSIPFTEYNAAVLHENPKKAERLTAQCFPSQEFRRYAPRPRDWSMKATRLAVGLSHTFSALPFWLTMG